MTMKTTLRKMFQTAQRSLGKLFGVNDYVWSAISRMGIGGGMVLAASGVMVTAEVALTISAYKRGVELLSTHVAKTTFRCEMVRSGGEGADGGREGWREGGRELCSISRVN